jgi:hypothetical protein
MSLYNLDLNTSLKNKKDAKKYWSIVNRKNLLGTALTINVEKDPKKKYLDLLKYKPKDKVLIPGLIVNTNFGEIIVYAPSIEVYDYNIFYEENVSLKRLCDFCNKQKFLVSIAHPFGLISKSATYLMGLNKLEKFISKNNIGVEIYNGLIGYLSYYMYDSYFLRKLRSLLDFFEFNDIFKYLGLDWFFRKFSRKLDQTSYDMVYKFEAAIKLGKKAKFVTAGSGTDSVYQIGCGILVIELPKIIIDEENNIKKNKEILSRIYNKKIKAVGPPGIYTEDLFERSTDRITKQRAYNDLVYLTKRSVK